MSKEIALSSGGINLQSQLEALLSGLRDCTDSEKISEYYTKVKAAREYMKIMGSVEKMRVELLQVEITCIVKMHELGERIKGVPSPMMEFFFTHGESVSVYLRDYPDCISARQIYNEYLRAEGLLNEREKGKRAGFGSQESVLNLNDDEMRKHAAAKYFDTQGAMKRIVDDYASSGKSFTVEKMADKFIEETSADDGESLSSEYKEGIREVCRRAISQTKIDTIGNKKAPRFVTYIDGNDELSDAERWMRIPFENASLKQLAHMVKLRQEQLRQDTIALENLQAIYEELLELSGGSADSDLSISQILKK